MARAKSRASTERADALWGTGNGGANQRRARTWAALAIALAVLALPLGALAGDRSEQRAQSTGPTAFVPDGLREAARMHRSATMHVIVVGEPGVDSGKIKNELMKDARGNQFGLVRREFKSVLDGLAADMSGNELLYLAGQNGIKSITPDAPMKPLGVATAQLWPQAVNLTGLSKVRKSSKKPVAIAVVDTGIDKDRKQDFGGRIVQSVELASIPPTRGSGTDYSGHGTIVAGIAAGSGKFEGAAPQAEIVSLRVMNEEGRAITSDVIAAADWVFENRGSYNIRVVNFSLRSPYPNYSFHDPLNEAARRLWLTGTVVVAAAGNTGHGRMLYAPASDPFVITVGAVDLAGTATVADDFNAPWTSYGYTAEGFAKPEIAAPGRRMIGPVSAHSRLVKAFPDRVVQHGYMWMSGTSFAAPVVAGAAAQIIARHPNWTPDQVKGALMLTARPLAGASARSAGVGEIDVAGAAALTTPPNPNAALNRFVENDSRVPGRRVFDEEAWAEAVRSDASWDSVSWSDVSWSDVSWTDVSWTDVSWSDVSWSDVSWSDVSWTDVSWTDVSWNSVSWSDVSWSDAGRTE